MKILLSLFCISILLAPLSEAAGSKIKIIAFDAFPIFDPRPIKSTLREMYPEKGEKIFEVWQTKQFAYSWLRTSALQYKDFFSVTEEALVYAAKLEGVDLSEEKKRKLMNQYFQLSLWPDVLESLKILKMRGYQLVFVSNFTEKMLRSNARHSKIESYFSFLSTDLARTYKPSPDAYNLVLKHYKVTKEEVLFVPFAAWDMAGAKWFGYRTFWLNRLGVAQEELGVKSDGVGKSLDELIHFL